jgi:hypothetical protein
MSVKRVYSYKYYVSIHYPSSCFYLKTPPCLYFKTRRFGDWIISPSSGETYSVELLYPEIGISSIDLAQLSRFYLKTETESNIRNIVFLNKNRKMFNVQKHNICINVPWSQTFRSCLLLFLKPWTFAFPRYLDNMKMCWWISVAT